MNLRRPGTIAFVIPVYRNERAVTLTYELFVAHVLARSVVVAPVALFLSVTVAQS